MSHFISKKCTSCHKCLPLCPTQSIYVGLGQYVIDTDTCEDCGVCVQICPESAILPVVVPKAEKEAKDAKDAAAKEAAAAAAGAGAKKK